VVIEEWGPVGLRADEESDAQNPVHRKPDDRVFDHGGHVSHSGFVALKASRLL
jgi:hypothetical protein